MKLMLEVTVFPGTLEEAHKCYRTVMAEHRLSGQQEFVLLRYLDFDVPSQLERECSFMTDPEYKSALSFVLSCLPAEAKIPL